MHDLVRLVAVALIALATIAGGTAAAQQHVSVSTDVLLYGDNTEFRNPFREGETIFGATARVAAAVEINPRLTLALGVLTSERFGSDHAYELVRPVIALTVRGARSAFVFGTLPPPRSSAPMGPDRMGPHALLPPLQRETLSFERPHEAGLQWSFGGARLRHEMWLEWQRLNTPGHRERLDAGVNADIQSIGPITLPVQIHIVHQGGQLFASGPVADSVAAAAGVKAGGLARARTRLSIEGYALISRYVPDRALPDRSRDGTAFFGRATAEGRGWRVHLIAWRGRNFIKDEGDPNYLSVTRAGDRYRGTRDYAELGGARRFELASDASLEVSARLHRVEGAYEYSYRITSTINVLTRIR